MQLHCANVLPIKFQFTSLLQPFDAFACHSILDQSAKPAFFAHAILNADCIFSFLQSNNKRFNPSHMTYCKIYNLLQKIYFILFSLATMISGYGKHIKSDHFSFGWKMELGLGTGYQEGEIQTSDIRHGHNNVGEAGTGYEGWICLSSVGK